MPNALATPLHISAAETASNVSASFDLGPRTLLVLTLDYTVATGTSPTLAVTVEHSQTGSSWDAVASFGTFVATGAKSITIPSVLEFVRVRWTIGGTTPSCTFAVTGTAYQLFCEPSDLTRYAIPEPAMDGFSEEQVAMACLGASDEAAGYLASAYTLPITAWDSDLRKNVAYMVVADLITARGYDPESGMDKIIQARRDAAVKWLDRIADGRLKPPGIVDQTPYEPEQEAYVVAELPRGWLP